jgi:hypothetical protein
MTDDEIATYCGVAADDPLRPKFIATLTPQKRALFDRMKQVEIEAALWVAGLGPKPQGVLIDTVRSTRRRKAWR